VTLRAAVVVLAAGSGTRVGADTNKVLLPLAGVPVLAWSLRQVQQLEYVDQVVVVHRPEERDAVARAVVEHCPGLEATFVAGGDTRHASEWNALQALAERIDDGLVDVVAIHDAARPLADAALFDAVVTAAHEHGGALPVRPLPGVLAREVAAEETPPGRHRAHVEPAAVQTPQAFRAGPLLDAYRRADAEGFTGTDTASCVERYAGLTIRGIPSPATNLKVTFAEDVALAERLIGRRG
jgi:2-C-methyl-D-erythritol 4-phosphate cytidylyltransferase